MCSLDRPSSDRCRLPCCHRRQFAVVDVETTGLDPHTDEIVEIAVLPCDTDGRPDAPTLTTLVQPAGPAVVTGTAPGTLVGTGGPMPFDPPLTAAEVLDTVGRFVTSTGTLTIATDDGTARLQVTAADGQVTASDTRQLEEVAARLTPGAVLLLRSATPLHDLDAGLPVTKVRGWDVAIDGTLAPTAPSVLAELGGGPTGVTVDQPGVLYPDDHF